VYGKGTNAWRDEAAAGIYEIEFVASVELFNKVKYRYTDSPWMLVVHFFESVEHQI
jgi:hypothetical protein